MIEKKVKSVWHGKIGIHEKYLKQAREEQSGILLNYSGIQEQFINQQMFIPFEELDEGKVGEDTFPERHGGGSYHLVYFKWENNRFQPSLL